MFSVSSMKFPFRLQTFKAVFATAFLAFSLTGVSASATTSDTVSFTSIKLRSTHSDTVLKNVYSMALKGLIHKLEADFNVDSVEITLDEVGHLALTGNIFEILGNGTFTKDGGKSWQPFEFEISVDSANTKLSFVEYHLFDTEAKLTDDNYQKPKEMAARYLLEKSKPIRERKQSELL